MARFTFTRLQYTSGDWDVDQRMPANLLHSLVDYPLRTPALMTVAALLAGISVMQRSHATGARESRADHL